MATRNRDPYRNINGRSADGYGRTNLEPLSIHPPRRPRPFAYSLIGMTVLWIVGALLFIALNP